jgi:hypothetical protein
VKQNCGVEAVEVPDKPRVGLAKTERQSCRGWQNCGVEAVEVPDKPRVGFPVVDSREAKLWRGGRAEGRLSEDMVGKIVAWRW